MSSYSDVLSTSPPSILVDTDDAPSRRDDSTRQRSPTLRRTMDEEEARERQRTLDVDSAIQLCEYIQKSTASYANM